MNDIICLIDSIFIRSDWTELLLDTSDDVLGIGLAVSRPEVAIDGKDPLLHSHSFNPSLLFSFILIIIYLFLLSLL